MQVELSNGTFDYERLAKRHAGDRWRKPLGNRRSRQALTPFRADVPQLSFILNRREAETYGVKVSDVVQRP